ncbi:MAK10-like protein [Tanacetum coccineum]
MENENLIRTLGDYSKPKHEGYQNSIELPVGNNMVPLQSDTIRLVQNECSFYGLRSEDPNQHLKDFLKLADSLDLDVANRKRTRLRLFQFSLRDQASNWLERLLTGSISTWEDLTTHFLVQVFPPGRTVKLRNGILMNADESWKIIKNLALYDHERWNDSKDFVKPFKVIATSQNILKMPVRRLLELEDHINFLLKRPQPVPRARSAHVPQAYAEAAPQIPTRETSMSHRGRILSLFAKPQSALGTNFKARVRDYMAAHTKRMERFENAIFKQWEEINDRMTEMFGLLKELTASRTLEKVLIREEARDPVTKNVNSISLIRGDEEKGSKDNAMFGDNIENPDGSDAMVPLREVKKENEAENKTKNEPVKSAEKKPTQIKEEESVEAPSSQPVGYYLKHKIKILPEA